MQDLENTRKGINRALKKKNIKIEIPSKQDLINTREGINRYFRKKDIKAEIPSTQDLINTYKGINRALEKVEKTAEDLGYELIRSSVSPFLSPITDAIKSKKFDDIARELKDLREAVKAEKNSPGKQSQNSNVDDTNEENIKDHTEDVKEDIVQSIELKPLPPKGKKHQNRIVLTYSDESNDEITEIRNEEFCFLYFLCLERLEGKSVRWMSMRDKLKAVHIQKLRQHTGNKTLDYRWMKDDPQQKSTIVSRMNKYLSSIIINDRNYYTLTPEIYGENCISLSD